MKHPFVKTPLLILFILLNNIVNAQNYPSDCITTVAICNNDTLNFQQSSGQGNVIDFTASSHNISNPSTNPASTNSGCLFSGEINSTWLLIYVASNGTLEFNMAAGTQTNCLDWIMWPYNINTCSGIFNNTLAPIRCNWNAACSGCGTGIGPVPSTAVGNACYGNYEPTLNVNSGDAFLLCISNFIGQSLSVPINFTGTAQLACSATFYLIGDTICEGQTAIIKAIGGSSHDWSANSGISLMNNNTLAWVSPTATTQYIVSANVLNAGIVYDTTTVVVLPASDPQCQSSCTININPPSPICEGSIINVTADTLNGFNYNWIAPNGHYQNNQNFILSSIPLWNDSVLILIVDSGLIQCSDTITLSVLPKPYITITPPTDTICVGDTVHFTFSGANWYTISPSNGIINYQMNGFSAVLYFSETYQIYGNMPNGCFDMKYLPVYVKPGGGLAPNITYSSNNVLTTNVTMVQYQWSLNGNPIPGATGQSYTPLQNGSYTLTVTYQNGCIRTSPPFIVTNVGINETSNSSFNCTIFPNPTNTFLNIHSNDNFSDIKIYDFIGKCIYHEGGINTSDKQINVETLKSGIYILSIVSEKGSTQHKFVKE
ncbi:MAG: hypothetical protein KatS3mg027_1898 [Bacteroidia bacterium]|nr:MAG: hypothetical protein KatS3mg027_1898 [Bacteroidia bacterium]